MPEALARSHNDFILSRAARQAPGKSRPRFLRAGLMWLLSLPARSIAGAALAAVLVGIVVNALALQKERHPAPLFASKPAASAPAAAPPLAQGAMAPPAAQDAGIVAVQPPARPVNLGVAADAPVPAAAHPADPIRDLLRGDGARETPHLTLAAQNALGRLGYSIKANGVAGPATLAAIHEFERAHGLPLSTEITAKLVKQLTAAAASEN